MATQSSTLTTTDSAPKKTKILYIITKSNWGGAQRYVYDLATGLSKEKYETEVILGGDGPLATKLREAGVPVTSLPGLDRDVSIRKDLGVFFKLYRLIRQKRPDVVHLNSSKIGAIGALVARLAAIRIPITKAQRARKGPTIIFTAHGWAFNENRALTSKNIIKGIYWLTLFLSHHTIAVSEQMKAMTTYWPIVRTKVSVVHNGVSKTPGFSVGNARLELTRHSAALKAEIIHTQKNYNDKDIIWIGTIAELHHIKGHETAIRGIKEYVDNKKPGKKILYAIIGDGEQRAVLEKLITDLALTDTVFLLGHMDNASQYLKAFNIFMLASLSEGLGYVIIEAGMAGLPIIATAVGGIPEIVTDMKTGVLVQPQRPKEIAHAIDYMLDNEASTKQYAEALHKKIFDGFSIDTMLSKTEAFYVRK